MPVEHFQRVRARLAGEAIGISEAHGVLVLQIEGECLLPVVHALKGDLGFDLLLDVTAVDWLPATPRFEVVWHFYSTQHFVRVRLKTRVSEAAAEVDSLTALYGAAAFTERECHDLYGIRFRGNADLRPILLYEGFTGHPLRKDYRKDHEQPIVPYRLPQG